ncbi:DUF3572 domain-containing protein [Palleronia sp. LCG004]|uniref:DUF3572 domain-containing protein n=1 Tax=Palleronia sp. LCG004 TaxID=3079304 RepID=UPI0029428864|nr:DUF3572 domain-containing protein [Palleronia sp. LCG004]WOI55051.1 DUF3572 domain-containing protein [Palleronia sp. LCG004]
MQRSLAYSRDDAETMALDVLAWLASEEDLLSVFMGSTGVSKDDFPQRLKDSEFLGAILEFLMMDDEWIKRYCNERDLDYRAPGAARAALPGGEQVHWT